VNLGVVGLGRMGVPIARRLLAAGHGVSVYNRSPGPARPLVREGAVEVDAPEGVWGGSEACITMVSDDKALREVTLGEGGLLAGPPSGRVLVDMSTISPAGSREIAEAARAAGVAYLRAPVSGNPSVVEAGNLGILVSGDRSVFDQLEPTLRDIGPNVFYVGEEEQARVLKLALNLMIAGTAELMAEALVLGEASGLDRAQVLEVIGSTAVGSPFAKYKAAALVADDYSPTFSTALMDKDLTLALAAGQEAGVPLPVTGLVKELLEECIALGLADDDFMVIVPRLRRDAGREPGIEIR
jgi:3-hydroxyisobutyrate dehydrogenase-like beta-hydroxyacid dehydrogenase